ncbi:MAG: 2-hydroxy-3-oxopropionate reductase [SAR116 cluster bacterium MED-G04]|jgi:3-hydroxyisobutyrate dehydrogenase-like beta-hydroxyacid dehydrogenase|nr:MAG: 2-hydroxy-3-oxopropionate reductase [SAR116 cluster bacterium MED-G04]|tara:strand:+ start:288 stop:1184 length:897 start_codon:yes stop_codon:yes gene_type:complete
MMMKLPVIGMIGLGAMGRPIALRLQAAGYPLTLYARRAEAFEEELKPLVEAGAKIAATPAGMAAEADIILLNVMAGDDVRSVMTGGVHSVLAGAQPGLIITDHSTIDPVTAREVSAAATATGAHYIDAPVSGGAIGAEAGTLVTMMGGDRGAVDRLIPVLENYTSRQLHLGESGQGSIAKLCNQIAQVITIQGVAEAMAFARSMGGDADAVRDVMLSGFASSRMLELQGPRMTASNYEPGMETRLLEKDSRIALTAALAEGLDLPALELTHDRLVTACGNGWDKKDVAILYELMTRKK